MLRRYDAGSGAGYRRRELLALHGVGPRAVTLLASALAGRGLAFAGERPPPLT